MAGHEGVCPKCAKPDRTSLCVKFQITRAGSGVAMGSEDRKRERQLATQTPQQLSCSVDVRDEWFRSSPGQHCSSARAGARALLCICVSTALLQIQPVMACSKAIGSSSGTICRLLAKQEAQQEGPQQVPRDIDRTGYCDVCAEHQGHKFGTQLTACLLSFAPYNYTTPSC